MQDRRSSGELTYGKFSRKRFAEIHQKESDDFETKKVEDWPFLEFICDTTPDVQVLVIRFLSSVVKQPSIISKALTEIVNGELWKHGYSVHFNPVVRGDTFWELVEESSEIYRLAFCLSSPNILGANDEAHEALGEVQKAFNNTELTIAFENEKGQLKVPKNRVETYREYADKGLGTWELVVKRVKGRGSKKRVKSSERAAKITVEVQDSEEVVTVLARALDRVRGLL